MVFVCRTLLGKERKEKIQPVVVDVSKIGQPRSWSLYELRFPKEAYMIRGDIGGRNSRQCRFDLG